MASNKHGHSHSAPKRFRPSFHAYSRLLPINFQPSPSSFLSHLIPSLCPPLPLIDPLPASYDVLSNSVRVSHRPHVLFLWQSGFFGKGNLSRSEPTWLQRAKNRTILNVLQDDSALKLTPEELTAKRRVERKQAKILKSKLKLSLPSPEVPSSPATSLQPPLDRPPNTSRAIPKDLQLKLDSIHDLEHLQLMNEEAFFLAYGLGCLDVFLPHSTPSSAAPLGILQLWNLFCRAAVPDHQSTPTSIRADNPFIISYIAYHHFRSLGWVVRSGIKFCTDWVLYGSRGPVGGHAEFAVCVMPVFDDGRPANQPDCRTSWNWLSTVNRVCSGVKKTLILAHVIVPSDGELDVDELESPRVLERYIIKEVAVKRFIPARARD